MTPAVLVLNAGSSSIKFAIYDVENLNLLCGGSIEDIGAIPRFNIRGPQLPKAAQWRDFPAVGTHESLTAWLLQTVRTQFPGLKLVAAGHRVVHGGIKFSEPVIVEASVLAELDRLVELAPGHEPHNIAAIRAVAAAWPALPQVVCFDTQFHRTQPRIAQLFALPRNLSDEGILRYGFHGLSYEFIASALPEQVGSRADGRVIVAHLGNGASLCAMKARRSMATTMSFTVLDGLMMGTRCGALDPGVILHLLQNKSMSAKDVSELLYNKSGLLGVSGISGDVRVLEKSHDPKASEALELFSYRVSCEVGSLVAVLGGLDVLVFTGGIGEHSLAMRQRICDRMQWLGIALDREANERQATRISKTGASIDVLVIPTNEELVIARATRALTGRSPA